MTKFTSQFARTAPCAFSVEQAADYIGVSRRTIFHLFASGDLPKTKIGRRTVVQRIHADGLLARSVERRDGENLLSGKVA